MSRQPQWGDPSPWATVTDWRYWLFLVGFVGSLMLAAHVGGMR